MAGLVKQTDKNHLIFVWSEPVQGAIFKSWAELLKLKQGQHMQGRSHLNKESEVVT